MVNPCTRAVLPGIQPLQRRAAFQGRRAREIQDSFLLHKGRNHDRVLGVCQSIHLPIPALDSVLPVQFNELN